MQIRIIIEHKYSYSHQKQICSYVKKEKREFLCLFFFTNQERNTKISRNHPRLRVIGKINPGGKGINKKKLNKKRRGEGRLSLERKGGIEALIRTR
jgi:hypothetical protein